MSLTITGLPELMAKLSAIAQGQVTAVATALYQEAEGIMTEAKQRTPVDTGALRASGHVAPPTRVGNTTEIVLAFGGSGFANEDGTPVDAYAIYVHEDLSKHHPVGQAKFLESAILEAAPELPDRIAERMKRDVAA